MEARQHRRAGLTAEVDGIASSLELILLRRERRMRVKVILGVTSPLCGTRN